MKVARTLTEAEERAGRLKAELRRRSVHPDVIAFCRAEWLDKNYFHAVFEATKSVADKIRQRTGLSGDGAELVDQAFGLGKTGVPMLALNRLQTDTERGEQTGLMHLMKGMFGAFRTLTSKTGFDVELKNAHQTTAAECKGGPMNPTKGRSVTAVFASAIGQAVTCSADTQPERLLIAVPDSPAFERGGRQILRGAVFQKTGIQIVLVGRTGVRSLDSAR